MYFRKYLQVFFKFQHLCAASEGKCTHHSVLIYSDNLSGRCPMSHSCLKLLNHDFWGYRIFIKHDLNNPIVRLLEKNDINPQGNQLYVGEKISHGKALYYFQKWYTNINTKKERHPLNANKLNSFLIYRAIPSQICCLHIKDIYLHPFLLAMYDLLHYCLHWKDQSHLCCS